MIPFYRPWYNHKELLAAIKPGPACERFEAEITRRAGAKYGIAFPYARMALVAAMQALEIPSGEIILPAYTCLVMAHAVMASGNEPAFVDISLADYNLDISKLKSALSPKTRAIVATHMFGYPTDVEEIRNAAGDESILIIEDAALGLHTLMPESSGLRGDLGLYSFNMAKPLSSVEGGVLVTNSAEYYGKIKAWRDTTLKPPARAVHRKQWARFLVAYLLFQPAVYKLWFQHSVRRRPEFTGAIRPEFDLPAGFLPAGSATQFTDFQAKLGLTQLQKLEQIVAKRLRIAKMYDDALAGIAGLYPAPPTSRATYAYYTVRISDRDQKNIRQRMARQGVGIDQAFDYALPYLRAYQKYAKGDYPQALQAANEVVNLPCYPGLTQHQIERTIQAIQTCIVETIG